MTRRRNVTSGEDMLKGHTKVLVEPLIGIEEADSSIERTHMQAFIDLIVSAVDDPQLLVPDTVKIISRLTTHDKDLKKVDAGDSSEWIFYVPDVCDVEVNDFKGVFTINSPSANDTADALAWFKESRSSTQKVLGLWELWYLLKQPKRITEAVLQGAGLSIDKIKSDYAIFPEIRFRAGGTWHTLALGYSAPRGKFEAYAIQLNESWQDDFYILTRTV